MKKKLKISNKKAFDDYHILNIPSRKPHWIILSLPLLASLYGIYLTQQSALQSIDPGMAFSPPTDKIAIIIGLVTFSVAYVVFLLILFSNNLKEFYYKIMLKRHHKH